MHSGENFIGAEAAFPLDPEVGDIVEITYNGGIQETYPASLEDVISIVVVKENE